MSIFASSDSFRPTEVTRMIDSLDSGAGTLIIETDAGRGYLKALGNPDSPHALVKDFLGSHLAASIGLPTFDYALVEISDIDELPFFRSGQAESGPAFVTRAENGSTWGSDKRLLNRIDNPDVISGLVAIDTWLRNTDRYFSPLNRVNLDNVFFSSETAEKAVSLRAMDFSHCIQYGGELTKRVADIDKVKDDAVYGLFPEFRRRLDRPAIIHFSKAIGNLSRSDIDDAVSLIPAEWYLEAEVRKALVDYLVNRASFVANTIESKLFDPPQLHLNLDDLPDGGES